MRKGAKPLQSTFSVASWCVVYSIDHAGNAPSITEIADHFNITRSHVEFLLNTMYKYGIAERVDNKLQIVGGQYLPPPWYIQNIKPPLAATDQTENARRNHHTIRPRRQT